jgi:hypothetical protein
VLLVCGSVASGASVPGCGDSQHYLGGGDALDAPVSDPGTPGACAFDGPTPTGGMPGTGGSSPLDGGTGGCASFSSAPFGAVVIEDFDRGPSSQASPNVCMMASPAAVGLSQCDLVGLNAFSCRDDFYCDVANGSASLGTVCPSYVQDECRNGYFLRLFYDVDRRQDAFAGVTLNISSKPDPRLCQLGPIGPVDLSRFDYLSMRVRPGDDRGNAEIALQDLHSNDNTYAETNPKAVLVLSPVNSNTYVPPLTGHYLPKGQWTEVQIKMCDLLKHVCDDGGVTILDRTAITRVLVGFAKSRFVAEHTDVPGPRRLDIDDIMLLPCATNGCQACR